MHIGDIKDDYEVIDILGSSQVRVKCVICGHEKVCSTRNLKKQRCFHSYRSCKCDYVKNLVGKSIEDYVVTGYRHDDNGVCVVNMRCSVCGHTKSVNVYDIGVVCLRHTASSCCEDYWRSQIGIVYGDYKITSIHHMTAGNAYYNVECVKCHTKCVKSLRALKESEFVHGNECFKNIKGEYKDVFSRRFSNMIQRCTNPNNPNYGHYGARGIKVMYEHLVDFYIDNIDQFTKYAAIHGVKNTTFDRIDVNGNYESGNIRMATQDIQSTNTTRKIYFVLRKGDELVLSDNMMEFGRKFGVNGRSIGNLVRGKSKSAGGWTLVSKSENIAELENINVTTKLITT